jgi:serine protease Do
MIPVFHCPQNTASICLLSTLIAAGAAADAQTEAEGLSSSFRRAAKQVLPSVVTVRVESAAFFPGPEAPDGLAMRPFDLSRDRGGSGVVIDAGRGLVLTNDHVVAGGPRVIVTLPDGRERVASQVRRDPKSDLALLSIDPEGLHAAAWGESERLDIGDWVLAVGQPFGLSGTVTAGIVSGKGRGIGLLLYEDLIQTDAAINPGNSGGPLVNLKGEVVGINTAIKTSGMSSEGVGFAVPSSRARRVAAELAEFGRVRRAYLGLGTRLVDPETARRMGHPGAVVILSVALRSPAAEAGLQPGDMILKVRGKPIAGIGSLQTAIEVAKPGEPLALTIVRCGQEREVEVRPTVQPDELGQPEPFVPPAAAAPAEIRPPEPPKPEIPAQLDARSPTRFPELGMRLSELTPELLRKFEYPAEVKGLLVRGVEPDGPADRGGLEIGMIITDAADRKVESLADFRGAVAKQPAERDLVVRIRKGNRTGFRVILDRDRGEGEPKRE